METAGEYVYTNLKKRILNQDLPGGKRLVERALAKDYGTSKTPVREALTRLAHDGLVVLNPLRGGTVKMLSLSEVIGLCSVRQALESLAVVEAMKHATEDKLQHLEEIVEKSRDIVQDVTSFQQIDREFHRYFVRMAENPILNDVMERMENLMLLVLSSTMALPGRGPRVALTEHERVLRAVILGDMHLAQLYMQEHIRATTKAVELHWQ